MSLAGLRPGRRRLRRGLGCLLPCVLLVALSGCAGEERGGEPDARPGSGSASGPIALSPDGRTVWVVNPDADSVTAIDRSSLTASAPVPVGREPWGVAVTPSGTVVVLNRADGSLSFLEHGRRTDLPIGPEPGGLALASDGRLAYVTVSSADEVAVVDTAAERVVERVAVGRQPWAIAVAPGGLDGPAASDTVVVTHRFARLAPGGAEATNDGKEAWVTIFGGAAPGGPREVVLAPHAFGFPNALEGIALAGPRAYLSHLLASPESPNDFQTTLSAALSAVSLTEPQALPARGLHLNEPSFSTPVNFPRALAASPDGATLYVVLAGSDAVMGVDIRQPTAPRLLGFWPTGRNPRGLVLDPDGARAYVLNYLSRDVSVLDLRDAAVRREVARVPVAPETLDPVLLRGKILFSNANDPRLSRSGWMSCESCHVDGGVDGTTWAHADGRRQTMPLWGLNDTAPFHIAATRDELQDFEEDVEQFMQGVGLAPGPANALLGDPNGGTSPDLDALAAFVLEGIRAPAAPDVDGGRAARGRGVFEARGCAACHAGASWTTSHLPGPPGTLAPAGEEVVAGVLHDVGTYDAATDRVGERGFDTPTLLGLHATAPYFHDGSAATLAALLAHQPHSGPPLTAIETADLVAFLRSIDGRTPPVVE